MTHTKLEAELLDALRAIGKVSVPIESGNAGVMKAWSDCSRIAREALVKAERN